MAAGGAGGFAGSAYSEMSRDCAFATDSPAASCGWRAGQGSGVGWLACVFARYHAVLAFKALRALRVLGTCRAPSAALSAALPRGLGATQAIPPVAPGVTMTIAISFSSQ